MSINTIPASPLTNTLDIRGTLRVRELLIIFGDGIQIQKLEIWFDTF